MFYLSCLTQKQPYPLCTIYPTLNAHIYGSDFLATLTAAIVLDRFFYESTDFDPDGDETASFTAVEYIIDDVIDFVNSEAGTSIAALTGVAGAKTGTVTGPQNAAVKLVLGVTLKEARYKISTNATMGPLGASESVGAQDPIFRKMLHNALNRLRGRSFQRT